MKVMTFKCALGVLVALVCCGLTGVAFADVVPPEASACADKSASDGCNFSGKDGTCKMLKCTRVVAPVDGGDPKTEEYDCLKCEVDNSGAPAPKPDGGSTTPDTGGTTDAATPTKSGGCDMAGSGARMGMGFVLLFLGFLAAWRMTQGAAVSKEG